MSPPAPSTPNPTTAAATATAKRANSNLRKLTGNTNVDFQKCLDHLKDTKLDDYAHFRKPRLDLTREPSAPDTRGLRAPYVVFDCIHCNTAVPRLVNDSSPGNLRTHIASCDIQRAASKLNTQLEQYGYGGKDIPATEILQVASIACATECLAFGTFEKATIKPLLAKNVREKVPTRRQISDAMGKLAEIGKTALIEKFKTIPGAVFVGHDAWTAPTRIGFLALVAYYLDDDFLKSTPIEMIPFLGSHSGVRTAELLKQKLKEFGIEEKVMGIVSDNASACEAAVKEIGRAGKLDGKLTWIRCFVHIVNLVMNAILDAFNLKPYAGGARAPSERDSSTTDAPQSLGGDAEEEEALLNEVVAEVEGKDMTALEQAATSMLAEDGALHGEEHADATDVLAFSFVRETASDSYTTPGCRNTLAKFAALAKALRYKTQVHERYTQLLDEFGIEGASSIAKATKTRWCATYEQMRMIEKVWPVLLKLQVVCNFPDENLLNEHDHAFVTAMLPVLKPLSDVTKKYSEKGAPQIGEVIATIDELFTTFETFLRDRSHPAATHNAVLRGFRLLKKYYDKTDDSLFYTAAILLHPSKRAAYLEEQEWEEEWISGAKERTVRFFKKWYADSPATVSEDANAGGGDEAALLAGSTAARLRAKARSSASATPADALSAFISGDPEFDQARTGAPDYDALVYWMAKQAAAGGRGRNPIADFAVDVFCCPASTVDVERVFSRGRRTVGDFQHRLPPAQIANIMNVAYYHAAGVLKPGALARATSAANAAAKRRSGATRSIQAAFKRAAATTPSAAPAKKAKTMLARTETLALESDDEVPVLTPPAVTEEDAREAFEKFGADHFQFSESDD